MPITSINDNNSIIISEVSHDVYSMVYNMETSRATELLLYYNYSAGDENKLSFSFSCTDPDFVDGSGDLIEFPIKVLDATDTALDYSVDVTVAGKGRIPIPTAFTENKIIIKAEFDSGTEGGVGSAEIGLKENDTIYLRKSTM